MRGGSVKATTSAKKFDITTPHQSKIKDFCQLPPKGKPFSKNRTKQKDPLSIIFPLFSPLLRLFFRQDFSVYS